MSSITEEAVRFHALQFVKVSEQKKPVKKDFKVEKLVLPYEQIKEFRHEKLNFRILIHKCNGIL